MTFSVDGLWGFYIIMGIFTLLIVLVSLPTIIDNFKSPAKKHKHVRRG